MEYDNADAGDFGGMHRIDERLGAGKGEPAKRVQPVVQAFRPCLDAAGLVHLQLIAGALHKLEAFAAEYGANFYGLPHNEGSVTLVREEWRVPQTLDFGGEPLVPLRAGDTIPWKLA